MKKITLLASLFFALYSQAQNGLEGIVVEKYYVSDAADSADADANGAVYPLHVGSVTYRVYADLLPGYSFIMSLGNQNHPFKVSTTTAFYNDPNYGVAYYNVTSQNNTKKYTQLIDSYFTAGGVASGLLGVPKTEDTDGSIGNTQGILANADATAGIPITGVGAQDGLLPGTPIVPNVLGITTELDIFDQTAGNTFQTNNGSIAALGGAQGATESNMVLLGQFTTDGIFSFEWNLQIGTPTPGQSQIFVASNPVGAEIQDSSLIYTSYVEPDTTAGIEEFLPENAEVAMYPNPTNDKLNITIYNYKSANNEDTYTVSNLSGQILEENKLGVCVGKLSKTLDMSAYQSGVYFITLKIGDRQIVRQVIKN
ncbi:MAG: T9SS type A sorting domain-containing protein [Flavobacteriia bacterium]